MTTYDKIIRILSNVLKTFLTCIIAVIAGALTSGLVNSIYSPGELDMWLGILGGIYVFWVLCPYETKNWIRNWTKPTYKDDDNDGIVQYIADGLHIAYPDINIEDPAFLDCVKGSAASAREHGITNKVAIMLIAVKIYKESQGTKQNKHKKR